MKTGYIIAISVGVLALVGGIAYFVMKKKDQPEETTDSLLKTHPNIQFTQDR